MEGSVVAGVAYEIVSSGATGCMVAAVVAESMGWGMAATLALRSMEVAKAGRRTRLAAGLALTIGTACTGWLASGSWGAL